MVLKTIAVSRRHALHGVAIRTGLARWVSGDTRKEAGNKQQKEAADLPQVRD